jgi:hypothetical protein
LVPPMFTQDVGGIGLAREVCHQDILWCYCFSNTMERRTRQCVACVVWHVVGSSYQQWSCYPQTSSSCPWLGCQDTLGWDLDQQSGQCRFESKWICSRMLPFRWWLVS